MNVSMYQLCKTSSNRFKFFCISFFCRLDWQSYFDIGVTRARKPGFFFNNRPFLRLCKWSMNFHLSLAPLTLSGGAYLIPIFPASGDFFKSLLLLHFLLDSFETRYTYFLGQSPNFDLFRFFKFGFSDFL